MATVTMDIAELDKLRQELKDLTKEKNTLEKEIADVKADKRVILKYKPINKSDLLATFDYGKLMYYEKNRMHYGGSRDEILIDCIDVSSIVKLNEKPEFVNFEDVKEELRKILEQEFAEELADLKHTKKTLHEKIKEKELEHIDLRDKLLKEHRDEEELLRQEIDDLVKKYKQLEEGKKELTRIEELEKQYAELLVNFEKEKLKSWWKKLIYG